MNVSKFFGSTMIVIGTTIGAGMLALPLVSSTPGFLWSLIIMLGAWLLSIITGLLVIEANMVMPIHSCTLASMAKHLLGNFGKVITWISFLFLLYSVISAYVIGGSNLIATTTEFLFNIRIPTAFSAILFTSILGIAVFWSTGAVDYFNRSLISVKGLLLVITLAFITPNLDITKLITPQSVSQFKYIWAAIPVFIFAFGYHFVLPSLRIYIGDKPQQLKMIVITGTTVALIIYLWWLAATLGTIPLEGDNGFLSIVNDPHPPGGLINVITILINNKLVTTCINGFSNVALTTSFLGVALGLFDFLADGFKRPNTRFGRLQTAGLTFIPPLAIALFFPKAFVVALTYAAIPLAILTIILPALMVYYSRKNPEFKSPYRVKCGNIMLGLVILLGFAAIALAMMSIFDILPKI